MKVNGRRCVVAVSAAALAVSALAGCAAGQGDKNAALIQKRYGSCLTKLGATVDQKLDYYVTYDTAAGFLTFKVAEHNGRTYTLPDDAGDVAILSSVGC